jgi:hypothetical protein
LAAVVYSGVPGENSHVEFCAWAGIGASKATATGIANRCARIFQAPGKNFCARAYSVFRLGGCRATQLALIRVDFYRSWLFDHALPRQTIASNKIEWPLLADFVAEVRCKLFWSVIPSL